MAAAGEEAPDRYPRVLRLLHWAIALLVPIQLTLALLMRNLQSLDFGKIVLDLHQQFGLTILWLVIARLALAWRYRAPRPDRRLPSWQSLAARLVHVAMMALLAAQPLLGLLTAWARGVEVTYLHLITLQAPIALSNAQGVAIEGWHRWLAYVFLALLLVHVGAVLFNRLVRGIDVSERMLGGRDRSAIVNRMPLTTQLGLCCGAILLITLSAGLYSAHKYSQFNVMRGEYEDVVEAKLDALRDAQLLAHDMRTEPDPATAATVVEALKDALPVLKPQDGLYEAKAAAAAFERIAAGDRSRELAGQASTALDNAVMAFAMEVFERELEIAQTAAEGHDLIILALAPTVLVSAMIAFLMSRSILHALNHARRLVAGISRDEDEPAIDVRGNGEFASLLRDIISMREAVLAREREKHARQAQKDRLIVDQLAGALAALARGDLTYRLDTPFPDETEQIRQDFNTAIGRLESAIAMLRESAHAVDADALSVREAVCELAVRTEQRAASLNDTAEAVATVAADIDATRDGVVRTSEAMAAARSVTDASGALMEQTIAAMEDVEVSSRSIMEVISLIDQIAFQTNILALNAAIEAARAGEVGKGFGVVAGEVRALANRAGDAANQVRELIGASDSHVASGVTLVHQSGEAMRGIVANIETVDGLVGQISASAQKQAAEIQRISRAVADEDRAVQQNAGMAEESMAALDGICRNISELAGFMARFRVNAPSADAAIEGAEPPPARSPIRRVV